MPNGCTYCDRNAPPKWVVMMNGKTQGLCCSVCATKKVPFTARLVKLESANDRPGPKSFNRVARKVKK